MAAIQQSTKPQFYSRDPYSLTPIATSQNGLKHLYKDLIYLFQEVLVGYKVTTKL